MRRLKSRGELRSSKRTFAIILICIAICFSLAMLLLIIFSINHASFEEIMMSFAIFFTFLLIEWFIIMRIIKTINRK